MVLVEAYYGKVYKETQNIRLLIFMGKKKKNKNKKKKINPKKERYAKFRKEKLSNMSFTSPDLTPEQQKQRQEDEKSIDLFLRHNKNRPTKEISERKMKSKR